MDASGENATQFPTLPILSATEVAARSQSEKYGGLFYLGIAGLVFTVALVGWFAFDFWNHRDIWKDVYILNNPQRSEADRVQAAFRLSKDFRLDDSQRMEMCLGRNVPDLARYLLAEAVSTEAVARDPRGFALAAARSPDWPDWLRLLLSRRLAYGAGRGYAIPGEALEELANHPDPIISLWATYAQAVQPGADPQKLESLQAANDDPSDIARLAKSLIVAYYAANARESALDEATLWLRHHHPQAAKIWKGWDEMDGRLVPVKAH